MKEQKAKEMLPHSLLGFASGVSAISNAISTLWAQSTCCRKEKNKEDPKSDTRENTKPEPKKP